MVFWQKWKEKLNQGLLAKNSDQDEVDHEENSHHVSPEQHITVIPSKKLAPYEVVETFTESRFWKDTERIRGYQSLLSQETFIPEIECQDEVINRYFRSR